LEINVDKDQIGAAGELLGYVRGLEGLGRRERAEQLLCFLDSAGFKPAIQSLRYPLTRNFILDFAPRNKSKYLLFSAHYDAVKGSPGANDNASGVAVLLGLCMRLKDSGAPVRAVFFDREEAWLRTPWLRLGLLGSLAYVLKCELSRIESVYNLEFCGRGDRLVVWPVKKALRTAMVFQRLEKVAGRLGLAPIFADPPWWLMSSDHLPFRMRGIRGAASLSLLPATEVQPLKEFVADLRPARVLFGPRPRVPGTLAVRNSIRDSSAGLSEDSLRLMLAVLVGLVEEFSRPSGDIR
jgi:hypothetical protein